MKEKIFEELKKRISILRKFGGWRRAGFDGIRKYPDLSLAVNLFLLYHAIDEEKKSTKLVALEDEQMTEFQRILASAGFSDEVNLEFC